MICIVHDWGKWSEKFRVQYSVGYGWDMQERVCGKCGKIDRRHI